MNRTLLFSLSVILGLVVLIQAVPYGRSHTNPPVAGEPAWDTPETRDLFFRACADCHSNETDWPWYSNVAPASWLLQKHVDNGRRHLNVSEWGVQENDDADEAAEMVREGQMPLPSYLRMHPEARLTAEEQAALIRGLEATFGMEAEETSEAMPADPGAPDHEVEEGDEAEHG